MGIELNLRDKGSLVESLWHAVDGASGSLANVPGLIDRVLQTEAWRKRICRGKQYEHPDFLSFITAKPLAGCGWPVEKVAALLKGEPAIEAKFREATTGPKHVHHTDGDNVTITPKRGNDRAYTLARLQRERPDLFERVIAKDLSANAAAIEAGWRKLPTPFQIVCKLLPKLTAAERKQLATMLADHP